MTRQRVGPLVIAVAQAVILVGGGLVVLGLLEGGRMVLLHLWRTRPAPA